MCVGAGSDDCGAQPVGDRPTGSLGSSVDIYSAKGGSKLLLGKYPHSTISSRTAQDIHSLATTYDFSPRVSRAIWSQEGDVGVSSERGIYSGSARHVDSRGKVEVSGFPHRQGHGDAGDVSLVRERPIVPIAGGTSHPTRVLSHGVK